MNRSQRMEKLGLLKMLSPASLDGIKLAERIQHMLDFKPEPNVLDLGGAARSARIIARQCELAGLAVSPTQGIRNVA